MAQETKHSCDKCGRYFMSKDPSDKRFAIYTVVVEVRGGGNLRSENSVEWCRDCCVKEGLVIPGNTKEAKAAPHERPTFDEAVAVIVSTLKRAAAVAQEGPHA